MANRIGRWTSSFQSLKIRNFRLFIIGQGISQVGNWLTLLTQSLLVLHLTKSGLLLGIVGACQFLPTLLLSPWAGLLADRADKRMLLIRTQSLSMLQSFALVGVALMNEPSVALLCLLAAAGGVLTAFDSPSRRAMLAETVPERDVLGAVNLNSVLMTSSTVVGPALGGFLIVTFNYATAFAIDAVSYVAVLTALLRMTPSEMRRPKPVARAPGQIRYGLKYVFETPILRITIGMGALAGAACNYTVTIALLVQDTFHRSTATFTVVYTALSLGAMLGALSVGRRDTIVARDLIGRNAGFAAGLVLLALAPRIELLFVLAPLVGYLGMSQFASSVTVLQLHSDPRMRGRVMATSSMCFLGAFALGAPMLGLASEIGTPRAGVLMSACCVALAVGWGVKTLRSERDVLDPRPATQL